MVDSCAFITSFVSAVDKRVAPGGGGGGTPLRRDVTGRKNRRQESQQNLNILGGRQQSSVSQFYRL